MNYPNGQEIHVGDLVEITDPTAMNARRIGLVQKTESDECLVGDGPPTPGDSECRTWSWASWIKYPFVVPAMLNLEKVDWNKARYDNPTRSFFVIKDGVCLRSLDSAVYDLRRMIANKSIPQEVVDMLDPLMDVAQAMLDQHCVHGMSQEET